ncbi:hypothetical protein Tco_0262324 [Tanacetum coccineum]
MVGFGGDDEGDDDGMMRVVALLLWLPDGEEKRRVKESVYGDRLLQTTILSALPHDHRFALVFLAWGLPQVTQTSATLLKLHAQLPVLGRYLDCTQPRLPNIGHFFE